MRCICWTAANEDATLMRRSDLPYPPPPPAVVSFPPSFARTTDQGGTREAGRETSTQTKRPMLPAVTAAAMSRRPSVALPSTQTQSPSVHTSAGPPLSLWCHSRTHTHRLRLCDSQQDGSFSSTNTLERCAHGAELISGGERWCFHCMAESVGVLQHAVGQRLSWSKKRRSSLFLP